MITKRDLNGMVWRLIRLTKKENLQLDHNSSYGGYLIVEVGEKGSESHPYGHVRMKTKEMYYALNMLCCALEETKRSE